MNMAERDDKKKLFYRIENAASNKSHRALERDLSKVVVPVICTHV